MRQSRQDCRDSHRRLDRAAVHCIKAGVGGSRQDQTAAEVIVAPSLLSSCTPADSAGADGSVEGDVAGYSFAVMLTDAHRRRWC